MQFQNLYNDESKCYDTNCMLKLNSMKTNPVCVRNVIVNVMLFVLFYLYLNEQVSQIICPQGNFNSCNSKKYFFPPFKADFLHEHYSSII